jgi:TolB protein
MNSCNHDRWLGLIAALFTWLAVEPTMGETLRLTEDGVVKTDPVFVDRSGNELVYVVNDIPTRMRLMKLRLSEKTVSPVHADETRAEFEPSYSADGRLMAFVQSRGNLSLALVVKETNGTKESSAVLGSGFAGLRAPSFSPDGTRVVYSFPDDGRQQISSCNLEVNDRRVLIDSVGINNWPSWSPDGKRLLFASSRDDDFEIYTANADGSQPQRLTRSPKQDIRPRWSPDGKRIAFTSNRDGNYEIYVMLADGSEPRRVTDHAERDDYATWHPDGKRLVVVSERRGKSDLYLVDAP